jgi:hypothetical protein
MSQDQDQREARNNLLDILVQSEYIFGNRTP